MSRPAPFAWHPSCCRIPCNWRCSSDVVAPGIGCLLSRPRRILVFGFREQPIGLAGHFGKPCRVALGVVPGDEDPHTLAAAKAAITDTLGTIAIGDAGIPRIECQREFGHR